MPSESTTLLVTARMTTVDIIVRATSVTPKEEEYITAVEGFPVNEEDEHAHAESDDEGDRHVREGHALEIFEEARFEDVGKAVHWKKLLIKGLFISAVNTACGVFGKGIRAARAELHRVADERR